MNTKNITISSLLRRLDEVLAIRDAEMAKANPSSDSLKSIDAEVARLVWEHTSLMDNAGTNAWWCVSGENYDEKPIINYLESVEIELTDIETARLYGINKHWDGVNEAQATRTLEYLEELRVLWTKFVDVRRRAPKSAMGRVRSRFEKALKAIRRRVIYDNKVVWSSKHFCNAVFIDGKAHLLEKPWAPRVGYLQGPPKPVCISNNPGLSKKRFVEVMTAITKCAMAALHIGPSALVSGPWSVEKLPVPAHNRSGGESWNLASYPGDSKDQAEWDKYLKDDVEVEWERTYCFDPSPSKWVPWSNEAKDADQSWVIDED